MNTIADKREARRRRILENSERRLQRITGKTSQNEFEDLSNKVTTNIASDILDLEANGICINKPFLEDENDALCFEGDSVTQSRGNASINTCFNLSNENISTSDNSYKHNDKYGCTNKKSNVKYLASYNESTESRQEKNIKNYQSQPNVCNKGLLSCNLFYNRISYVILATIVNVLLMYKMDYIFGKNILLPYFVVMLTHLCIGANIQEPQHGNLLIATLILCSIKPVLTYRFTWAMSMFSSIITNLAIYIFSFTLIYCTITLHFQDCNILFGSNM